jgi:hypothetical protein
MCATVRTKVNMVLDTAHNDWLAIEVGQNPAEVTMQFFTKNFVAQERSAFFRREHRMHQNFCERLRHELIQPFQG